MVVGSIQAIVDWVADIYDVIKDFFDDLAEWFSTLLSYLNPFDDNFFLKIAFVPSEDYMSSYKDRFNNLINTKLGVFFQFRDTLKAFFTALESNTSQWVGIKADLSRYGIGEQEIVSAQAMNTYGEKIRFWIGGFMIFFTVAFLWRKGSAVIGSGK